jgi:hypothetical protein
LIDFVAAGSESTDVATEYQQIPEESEQLPGVPTGSEYGEGALVVVEANSPGSKPLPSLHEREHVLVVGSHEVGAVVYASVGGGREAATDVLGDHAKR